MINDVERGMKRYIRRFFAVFVSLWRYALSCPSAVRLILNKSEQIDRYLKLRGKFEEAYMQFQEGAHSDISSITPLWVELNARSLKSLLPYPSRHFLKSPILLYTMFDVLNHRRTDNELLELEERYPKKKLASILEEDPVGGPVILLAEYTTSYTNVHYAFHLHRFFSSTGADPSDINMVVEFGGGYGRFALIFARFVDHPMTHVIIDTPLFCTLQWLYLSSILGSNKVSLITQPGKKIENGKVSIIPVTLLDQYSLSADLFVSTWALSESGSVAAENVADRNWFDARHILLSFRDNDEVWPNSELAGNLACEAGATRYSIPFLPGNYYVFR